MKIRWAVDQERYYLETVKLTFSEKPNYFEGTLRCHHIRLIIIFYFPMFCSGYSDCNFRKDLHSRRCYGCVVAFT